MTPHESPPTETRPVVIHARRRVVHTRRSVVVERNDVVVVEGRLDDEFVEFVEFVLGVGVGVRDESRASRSSVVRARGGGSRG